MEKILNEALVSGVTVAFLFYDNMYIFSFVVFNKIALL